MHLPGENSSPLRSSHLHAITPITPPVNISRVGVERTATRNMSWQWRDSPLADLTG